MSQNNRLFWLRLRTIVFGHPLRMSHAERTKVGVFGAVPVFGSDLISSQGYAPDEIFYVLLLAGSAGYAYVTKVSLVIVLLLASLFMVYRKAIQYLPQGGGSYLVSHTYLGPNFGIIAGAALTLDYILTVAVSISSSIENLSGMIPWLEQPDHKVVACLLLILFMAWINLRGLKESAYLFALPVYLYVASVALLIITGIYQIIFGVQLPNAPATALTVSNAGGMTWFLFARAMAGGTTALTGFEAVSSGVSAFKAPAQKRAIRTLFLLASVVALGLLGLTYLGGVYHIAPTAGNTVLNQLGQLILGNSLFYYILMGSAACILVIAANTPFAAMPILLSTMARDGYAPRYFKNLGDRLVFSVGIWALMIISMLLILLFKGNTHMMMPLYAIGVMISFSLISFSLARYTWQGKSGKWKSNLLIFIFGGTLSFIILLVFIITKFTEGAWVALLLIPVLYFIFFTIKKIYKREIAVTKITKEALEDFHLTIERVKQRREGVDLAEYQNHFIIPVYDINLIVLKACKYAYSLTPNVTAVHIASDPLRAEKLKRHWAEKQMEIPLEFVDSPYRATVHDFIAYLSEVERNNEYTTITVVIPEFVPEKLWHNMLHNQTGQLMKLMLLLRKSIIITSVPYHPATDRIEPAAE